MANGEKSFTVPTAFLQKAWYERIEKALNAGKSIAVMPTTTEEKTLVEQYHSHNGPIGVVTITGRKE